MRVTDLARKLKISTTDLRERLADFGVGSDIKDIPTKKATEIQTALKDGITPKEEEPEQELMGMFFESADNDDKDKEEENEKEEEEKSEIDDEESEEEGSEPEKPETESAAKEDSPALPIGPAIQRSTAEREAARSRWAAAKKASEKIIAKKVKKMETDKIKQVKSKDDVARFAAAQSTPYTSHGPKREIEIGDAVGVRELAQHLGISPVRIVGELFKNGVMANINQVIDFDTASIIAEAFNATVKRDTTAVSGEDLLAGNIEKLLQDEPENLSERPPIVAVMGHVDHGKTTLLDAIRQAEVAEGEAGGITQHIGAYQVTHKDRSITFLDTPGHEAFTAMRARGARATDIAILVCAAEEGVKPQTIEAINHAKDAGVPIIVALTKMDKEGANIDKVKGELNEHGLQAADWGGKIEMVPVSAKTGEGIEELLEMVLLVNDLEPVKGNPAREAVGTVIESHLDKSFGPVATVLINTGTLRTGDNFVIGTVVGRVKKMFDYKRKIIKEAPPGTPVQIAGLDGLPERGIGEILQVLDSSNDAHQKANELTRLIEIKARQKVTTMNQLIGQIGAGTLKELKIVVKADVEGSLEALRESLEKIKTEGVSTKIIHGGVGEVTETDVLMAEAANALLVAFHVKVPVRIEKIANHEGVTIRRHTIIYKLIEEVEKMLSGMLDPEEIEVELGTLEIRGIFLTKPSEQIVGGIVKDGKLLKNVAVRIIREEKVIGEGKITDLKREKESVGEVKEGFECGLKVAVKNLKLQEGDLLTAYRIEKQKRGA